MSDRPAPKATPSRRQAARLAAVQALYQWQEGEHAPAEIVEQFLNVRTGEAGEGGMRRDADRPLFKDVVEGTAAHKDELEQTVSAALADKEFLHRSLELNARGIRFLSEGLRELGLTLAPSEANFVMVAMASEQEAARIFEEDRKSVV